MFFVHNHIFYVGNHHAVLIMVLKTVFNFGWMWK